MDEVSDDLNEHTTPEKDIHELEAMINDLGYHNKMYVNSLLDYPGENNACWEIQTLEEIANSVLDNNVEDDVDDDETPMELVTRKEALKSSNILHKFLIRFENSTPELLDAMRKI